MNRKKVILLALMAFIVLLAGVNLTFNVLMISKIKIGKSFYVEALGSGGIEITNDTLDNAEKNVYFENTFFSKVEMNSKSIVAIDDKGKLYEWKDIDKELSTDVDYPMGDIKVKEVSVGDSHIAVITSEGKIFTWGNNEYSQLGIQDEIFTDITEKPTELKISNESFCKVSAGPLSTIAVTDTGAVYEWGYYENMLSEFEVETTQFAFPTKINLDYKIVDAKNGFLFNILLTEDGKVLGRGRNEYGQSMPNSEQIFINNYELIGLPERICEISVGKDYVLALGTSGALYAWGNCQFGNEILRNVKLIDIEGKIKYISTNDNTSIVISNKKKYCFGEISSNLVNTVKQKKYEGSYTVIGDNDNKIGSILKIRSGYAASIAVDASKNAYIWGTYLNGGLGNKETVDIDKPERIEKLKNNCLDIETVSGVTTILTNTGEIYNFGNNKKARLGIGNSLDQWEPVKVGINEKINKFFSGPTATIVNTELNNWYAWGNNEYGSLLTGDTNLHSIPVKINIPFDVEKISSYSTHTLLLDTDGNVYQYGSMEIDTNTELAFKKVNIVEKIIDISVGPQVCFAVSESGIVYAWGNNTDGYLGLSDKVIYTKPQKMNFVERITEIEVSPMLCQIVVLSENGNVYTWGFNSMRLLDKQVLEEPTKVELNEKINSIVVGDVTVYALTESGNIFTWGGVINNADKKPQREPILYSFE